MAQIDSTVRIAVLMTFFNRKKVTLSGLRSLENAINIMGSNYSFDIYVTDDGSADGTAEAVCKDFPTVRVLKGSGELYWGGGMNNSWKVAVESGNKYDFFLWFNDDSILYEDALEILFKSYSIAPFKPCIIGGAFIDSNGNDSYGGLGKDFRRLSPYKPMSEIHIMNGNLVLIPSQIFDVLGYICHRYKHGLGDVDYGLRATKYGFKVFLSTNYVGSSDRHDKDLAKFADSRIPLIRRMKVLYSVKFSPITDFYFHKSHYGILKAVRLFLGKNLFAMFPSIYQRRKSN